jgi:hypothetical protein
MSRKPLSVAGFAASLLLTQNLVVLRRAVESTTARRHSGMGKAWHSFRRYFDVAALPRQGFLLSWHGWQTAVAREINLIRHLSGARLTLV